MKVSLILPWFIGTRYIMAKKRNRYISFISLVSLLGLALGVSVLIIVVSVMNGFERELRHRILGVVPHAIVTIEGVNGTIEEAIFEQLAEIPQILNVARFQNTTGMLTRNGTVVLAEIYGIEPALESDYSILPNHQVYGQFTDLQPGQSGLILGQGAAAQLGVYPGDILSLVIPLATKSGNTIRPRIVPVTLVGTFEVGAELDYHLGLMHVEDLTAIVDPLDLVNRYRLAYADLFQAPKLQALIMRKLTEQLARDRSTATLLIDNWTDSYGDLFRAVEMEKSMMFLLLLMTVTIAAFNIVSGLVMLVNEKRSEIAILRTMGIDKQTIIRIFVVQGSVIGVIGVLVGLIVGVLLASNISEIIGFLESLTNQRVLAGTYFDSVPSEIRWGDISIVAVSALFITVLATIYPAVRASNLDPSSELRYE